MTQFTRSSTPALARILGLGLALTIGCGDDGDGGSNPITLGDASVMPGEPAALAGITDLHNQARAMVIPAASPPIPALAWSDTVAAAAQQWADGCQFKHSNNGYGENIYASGGFTPDAAGVVSDWVSEVSDYDYASNDCSGVCGHYTQVVWRDSTQLGCAIKHCTTGSPFGSNFPEWDLVVCEYDPPGNYGSRPY